MKKLLVTAFLLCLQTPSYAQKPETIVEWFTLKATSDYTHQLNALNDGESLIVWVGYTNYKLFEQIKGANNCYIDSLPGIKQGILIGEKENGTTHIAVRLDAESLENDKTFNDLISKYNKKLTTEERLLGSGFTVQKPEPKRITTKVVQAVRYTNPVGHTHTCPSCGNVWDHVKNPTHNCDYPKCRGVQFQQDSSPKMVPHYIQQLVEVN